MAKILFFFLCFISTAIYAQSEECSSSIDSKLLEILNSDKDKVITDQFLLTTLKISKKLGETSKTKTIEEHIRKTMSFKDPTALEKLKALYSQEAFPKDKEILSQIEDFESKSQNFNYFKKDQRMTNQDISTYMLIEKEINGADYDDMDLAITWYMQKMIEKTSGTIRKFSQEYNLRNITTHVARNRGAISDVSGVSNDIEVQYEQASARINSFSEEALKKIKSEVENCSQAELCKINISVVNASLARLISDVLPITEELGTKVESLARASTIQNPASTPKANNQPAALIVKNNTSNPSRSKTSNKAIPNRTRETFSDMKPERIVAAQDNTRNSLVQSSIVREIEGADPELVRLTSKLPHSWISSKSKNTKKSTYSCKDMKNKINFKIRRGSGWEGTLEHVVSVLDTDFNPYNVFYDEKTMEDIYYQGIEGYADSAYQFTVLFKEGTREVPYGVDGVKCLELLLTSKCPPRKKVKSDSTCKIMDPYEELKSRQGLSEDISDYQNAKQLMKKR